MASIVFGVWNPAGTLLINFISTNNIDNIKFIPFDHISINFHGKIQKGSLGTNILIMQTSLICQNSIIRYFDKNTPWCEDTNN